MSYKKASIISLITFLIIGVYGFVTAMSFPPPAPGIEIGPGYYPKLLSILMIVSSILGLIKSMKEGDKKIEFLDKKYFFFTFICIVLFALIWEQLGHFYIVAFIIGGVMLYILSKNKHTIKKLLNSVFISFLITICSYLIFSVFLGIPL